MKRALGTLLVACSLAGGCITIPGLPGPPRARPPRPTWTGQVEAAADQRRPFTLVGWDRAALDKRVEYSRFGIASKWSDFNLFFSVLRDGDDVNYNSATIDRLRAEAPYRPGERPNPEVQFWKLNLLTGENELISREQWHAAGELMSFTTSSLGVSWNTATPWMFTLGSGYDQVSKTYTPPWEWPEGQSRRFIPSRILSSFLAQTAGYAQVAAFCGTLRQPYSRKDDLCIEFMTKQNGQWHSLGVTQLVGTAGLREYDAEWGDLMGFVAQGRYWVYLFEDRLWVVPTPENPYLPPSAK